jgi:hypothetical protein
MPDLTVDGVPVAVYATGDEARPYLHPVRTLGGRVVTDARPADHPWHLGVSVAVQDVAGWNFWGGRTYVRGQGYVARPDHGRIEHVAFTGRDGGGFTERLRWRTPDETLLDEVRAVRAARNGPGWTLELITTLTNATDRPLPLGSPATNGRTGAGYGGLFWRLPPAADPEVGTATASGESATHGSTDPWLSWTDRAAGWTLTFTQVGSVDPWFVRMADYPGIGAQLAARDPLVIDPGDSVTRGWRVLVAD